MRGVAVTSRVWSTAPMNMGSMTALKSARKVERDAWGAGASPEAVVDSGGLTRRC